MVILGAAGRDFHNFNVVYRDDPTVEVVAFMPDAATHPSLLVRCTRKACRSPTTPSSTPWPHPQRFGSPLVLSRVHWVRPELVVEVKYLSWTEDGLLRQVVYEGIRDDKPASEVVRG